MKTVGIVLAGGLSRRFGSPKAFAQLEKQYFYEYAVFALQPHCDKVVIVTLPELINRFPNKLEVITDLPEFAGLGPLAGILSGMSYVSANRYIVLTCDMPYINSEVVGKLLALHDAEVTAVIASNRHHPLTSVWNSTAKPTIMNALEKKQLRVMNVLDALGVTWVDGSEFTDDEQRVFMNINNPTDMERR